MQIASNKNYNQMTFVILRFSQRPEINSFDD